VVKIALLIAILNTPCYALKKIMSFHHAPPAQALLSLGLLLEAVSKIKMSLAIPAQAGIQGFATFGVIIN
jgi:hypothetical protein